MGEGCLFTTLVVQKAGSWRKQAHRVTAGFCRGEAFAAPRPDRSTWSHRPENKSWAQTLTAVFAR
jgi:hypothetical protein